MVRAYTPEMPNSLTGAHLHARAEVNRRGDGGVTRGRAAKRARIGAELLQCQTRRARGGVTGSGRSAGHDIQPDAAVKPARYGHAAPGAARLARDGLGAAACVLGVATSVRRRHRRVYLPLRWRAHAPRSDCPLLRTSVLVHASSDGVTRRRAAPLLERPKCAPRAAQAEGCQRERAGVKDRLCAEHKQAASFRGADGLPAAAPLLVLQQVPRQGRL